MPNVNSLNSKTLQDMYAVAKIAAESGPSRTDTVIHIKDGGVGTEFEGHAWVRLGGRSAEFKDKNLAARKMLFDSVSELFGGEKNIPRSVLKEFKKEDFLLNKAGEVTSQRPLTARRIIAICDTAAQYIEGNKDKLYSGIDGFNQLTAEEQAEYRARIYANVKTNKTSIEFESHNFSPVRFLAEKVKANHRVRNFASDSFSSSPVHSLYLYMDSFATSTGGLEKALDRGHIDVDFLHLFDKLHSDIVGLDQQCFSLIQGEKCAGLTPREKYFVFIRLLENYDNKGMELLRAVPPKLLSFEEFLKTNFEVVLAEVQDKDKVDEKMKNAEMKIHFIRQFVEARKDEFKKTAGGVNNQIEGGAAKVINALTKYDNIMQTLSDSLKLKRDFNVELFLKLAVDESVFFQEWHKKLGGKQFEKDAEVQNPAFKDYYEAYKASRNNNASVNEAIQSFNKFCAGKDKWDAKTAGIDTRVDYPSTLTSNGIYASQALTKALGVSSHGQVNTAAQMFDAYKLFSQLDEIFFACLETDETKLDKLFEAMNMPGCLQARVEPIQEFKTLMVVGDVTVMPTEKDDLLAGIGKMAQYLGKNKVKFDYDGLVSRYLKEIGDKAKITLGSGAGTFGEFLGKDKDAIMAKYGSTLELKGANDKTRKVEMIRISAAFFKEPRVQAAIDSVYEFAYNAVY